MNLSLLLVKIQDFLKYIGSVCIQKLFSLIKMMYSRIKWMVFQMRMNALEGRS